MESFNNKSLNRKRAGLEPSNVNLGKGVPAKTQDPKPAKVFKSVAEQMLANQKLLLAKFPEEKKESEADQNSSLQKPGLAPELNDGECQICMSLMVEPIVFPCKHIFCA